MSLRPAGPTTPMTRRRGRWTRVPDPDHSVWQMTGTDLQIWRDPAVRMWRLANSSAEGLALDGDMNTAMQYVERNKAALTRAVD